MKFVSKCCAAPQIGELEVDLDRSVAFGYCKDCGCKGSFIEDKQPAFTPYKITKLGHNEVFCFGSNEAGRHGAGAAYLAVTKFGAVYGNGEGLQGNSYALPTKDFNLQTLPLDKIKWHVDRFLDFASKRSELRFLVTQIGCGLAGYKPEDIAPLFKSCPPNVVLPKEFMQVNNNQKTK